MSGDGQRVGWHWDDIWLSTQVFTPKGGVVYEYTCHPGTILGGTMDTLDFSWEVFTVVWAQTSHWFNMLCFIPMFLLSGLLSTCFLIPCKNHSKTIVFNPADPGKWYVVDAGDTVLEEEGAEVEDVHKCIYALHCVRLFFGFCLCYTYRLFISFNKYLSIWCTWWLLQWG